MIVIADEQDAEFAAQSDAMCRRMGAALQKAYPGRRWFVRVASEQGLAWVHCADVSLSSGYLIHLHKALDPERAAVMAGGSLLERFSLSRTGAGGEGQLVRDARGEAIDVG